MKNSNKVLYAIQIFLLIQLLVLAFLYLRDYPRVIFYDFIITTVYNSFFVIFIFFQKIEFLKKIIPIVIIAFYSLFIYFNIERIYIGSYWRFIVENKQELSSWIAMNDINQPLKIDQIKFVDINDSSYFLCIKKENIYCEGIAYSNKNGGERASMSIFFINTNWIHIFGNWYYWDGYDDY